MLKCIATVSVHVYLGCYIRFTQNEMKNKYKNIKLHTSHILYIIIMRKKNNIKNYD